MTKTLPVLAVIAVGIAVIFVVVFLPVKPGDLEPNIIDTIEPKDSSSVEMGTTAKDEPNFSDESSIGSESKPEFFIDENGTKHYNITVRDTPKMDEQER